MAGRKSVLLLLTPQRAHGKLLRAPKKNSRDSKGESGLHRRFDHATPVSRERRDSLLAF